MTARRIVRLLEPEPELNWRQRAQRKYRQSDKGRAAMKRARERRAKNPIAAAKDLARTKRWKAENVVQARVYNRIYSQRYRRKHPDKSSSWTDAYLARKAWREAA